MLQAFLYGYSMDKNLEVCGLYGSLMAGKVIEVLGAKMNNDTWTDSGLYKKH